MEAVQAGWMSILPPVIAIILAIITKDVVFSLLLGALSGTLIYSLLAGINPLIGRWGSTRLKTAAPHCLPPLYWVS